MIGNWPAKDPQDVRPYGIDWSGDLDVGETITTSVWTIVTSGTLTKGPESITGQRTALWLQGGTSGVTYEVNNHISTSTGQEIDRTAKIKVKDL